MILCAANQLGKMYGAHWVFEQLQFEIHEGERVGIVGSNGSGKTTLFKLLAGIEPIDQGELHIRKGTRIGYLAQIPVVKEGLTVREVLMLPFADLIELERQMQQLEQELSTLGGMDHAKLDVLLKQYGSMQIEYEQRGGYSYPARVAEISQGLGIHPLMQEMLYNSLSGGEKTKVGLASILMKEQDLLLLDEPTNHLDLLAIEWLEEFLQSYHGTVVIISHDRFFLDRVVKRILDLENGEITSYIGNYTHFVQEKQERLLAEFHAYQEQQKKIKKMEEAIKRLREWANRANPPNEGLHRRANSMQKALDRIQRLKRPILEKKKIDLAFDLEQRSGKDVVLLEQVSKHFGERRLLSDIDFQLRFKENIAIVGGNGEGKSTLIKLMLGELDPDQGKIKLGSNVKIGYLSQSGIEGEGEKTIIDYFREHLSVYEGEARQILSRFLFYGASVFRRIKELSGGERMRLRLAVLMNQELNFLILDEPTNHLDIDSREVLEEALAEFDGTILAISHDRYFLNKLFEITYWLESGTLTRYEGSYDYAMQHRRNRVESILHATSELEFHHEEKRNTEKHTQVKRSNERLAVTPSKSVQSRREYSLQQIEEEIIRIEACLHEIERKMEQAALDPTAYASLQEWHHEQRQLEEKRESLYLHLLNSDES